MLSINDLKSKTVIMLDKAPYQVMEVKHLHMGRGGSSVQTRIRNLLTGQVLSRNFKPGDSFEEADVEKRDMKFLYVHRDDFVFASPEKPAERFTVAREKLGDAVQWLKPNIIVTAMFLEGMLVQVTVPIKLDLLVTEAPPGVKGDTATGGTKAVTVETGAIVQTPLFIEEGDVIRVNTETGEYVERANKR